MISTRRCHDCPPVNLHSAFSSALIRTGRPLLATLAYRPWNNTRKTRSSASDGFDFILASNHKYNIREAEAQGCAQGREAPAFSPSFSVRLLHPHICPLTFILSVSTFCISSSSRSFAMLTTQKYHDPTYLQESWILYAIGVVVILLRFAVRIRTVGFRSFQGDDYLSLVVLACYTSDAVAVKVIQHHGSNVDWSQTEMQAMTEKERGWIAHGSKLQFACWFTYPTLVWALKGCMLFFVRSPFHHGLRESY